MKSVIWVALLFMSYPVVAQQNSYPRTGDLSSIARREMHRQKDNFHPAIQPYDRLQLSALLENMHEEELAYAILEVSEFVDSSLVPACKPVLKSFFRTKANFFELNRDDFFLRFNPLLRITVGSRKKGNLVFNQRGLSLRGGIGRKFYFQSLLLESQVALPEFFNRFQQKFNAVPGQTFYRNFDGGLFNIEKGYDFLHATGSVGFPLSKYLGFEFGYGQHYIGEGYRSLLISDFSAPYLFFKFEIRFWKLQFQSILAELSANSAADDPADELLIKKYMSLHYLSLNLGNRLNLGFFEAVVFNRSNHFELHYLNPIIFYRAIERSLGSADNVILGLQASYELSSQVLGYFQLVIDEFKLSEIFSSDGWWGNKYGLQLGLRFWDILSVRGFDGLIEWNTLRPYTFTHADIGNSFTHYKQPLAHPYGANFREFIFRTSYRPFKKISGQIGIHLVTIGEDDSDSNFGNNLLLSSNTRMKDYGNEILQGDKSRITMIQTVLSYQIYHQLNLDIQVLWRNQDNQSPEHDFRESIFSFGLRYQLPLFQYAF